MATKQDQQFKQFLGIFLRRKKIIGCCLLLGLVAGLGVYLSTPKKYKASALIKYQPQGVNPSTMSPDVQARTIDIVANLKQQVTSRTNLEEIITRFDLYPAARQKKAMEDIVVSMKTSDIEFTQQRTGEIFVVSYVGSDPKKVTQVTNALAAKFVEENIRFREERVTESSAYVQGELQMAKEALDKKDEAMRDYKLKYYNEMPQQLQNNMSRLNSLQTQYQNNQSNVQNLEQTRVLVQEQIAQQKELLSRMIQQPTTIGGDQKKVYNSQDPFTELAQMKMELEMLRSRYTEQHPEIKRLKNLIQRKEQSLQNLSPQLSGTSDGPGTQPAIVNPQLEQLEKQLREIELSINNLKQEKTAISSQIEKYKQWVESTPFREAEWTSLTRDYTQLNQRYQSLLAQNLAAESAQSLERSQKGSQFKIVDPAHMPEKPAKPNFFQFVLLALFLGLASGMGISYTLEHFDTTFKDASDVESYLGIPVACSIPMVYTQKERQQKKIQSILWALTFIIPTFVLTIGIIYLLQKGTIII